MKIDIRKVLGIVLGIAIVIEGGLLASMAAPARVDGIGTILEGTVLIAGVQLALLGLIVLASWFVLDLSFVSSRKRVAKILFMVVLAVNLIVMVEGMYLTTNATTVVFEGGDTFGMVAAGLLSAQLFMIGALSTVIWLTRGRTFDNILVWVAGVGSSIALAAVGALVYGVASPLKTSLLTNVGEGKMEVAGASLMVLSAVLIIGFVISGTKYLPKKLAIIYEVLFLAITGTVAAGSIYLSALAEYFELGDSFAAGKMYMAAFFAILFMLSAVVLSSWWLRSRKLSVRFIIEAVGVLAAIGLAGLGVEVFGLAGETEIDGLFTLPHIFVLMFGAQLILLPMIALALMLLRDRRHFDSPLMKGTFGIAMLLVASLIAFEGIAVMIASSNIDVVGFGSVRERYVSMFGAAIAVVGAVILLTWNLREGHSSPRLRRVEVLVLIFIGMMLMAALLI